MYFRPLLSASLLTCFWLSSGFAQTQVSWLGALPEQIQESSGLLLLGDQFITHNDSGNSPELFLLDSASLKVRSRVRIEDAGNTDWEDLAQDADYIYIGDIGNNLGSRKDLKVLKIPKTGLSSSQRVRAEVIAFRYEDQSEFRSGKNTDWDAEALIAGPDSLWVFTKQWKSQGTVVYKIPKNPGEHVAIRKAEFPVNGLITGASVLPGQSGIILSGYSLQLQPFIVRLKTSEGENVFQQELEMEQVDIPFAQVEGVAADEKGAVFLSSEAFTNKLFSLPAGMYKISALPMTKGSQPNPDSGNKP